MPPRERLSPKKTVGFLRRLTPRIRPYRFALVGAAVLMLMSTGVGLAFPLIVRELLDAAFLANDSGLLNRVALGLLGLFGVQAVVNFGQSYLTASVSERVRRGPETGPLRLPRPPASGLLRLQTRRRAHIVTGVGLGSHPGAFFASASPRSSGRASSWSALSCSSRSPIHDSLS